MYTYMYHISGNFHRKKSQKIQVFLFSNSDSCPRNVMHMVSVQNFAYKNLRVSKISILHKAMHSKKKQNYQIHVCPVHHYLHVFQFHLFKCMPQYHSLNIILMYIECLYTHNNKSLESL